MTTTLAMAWNPRGELPRLQRELPRLTALYDHIVLTLPPEASPKLTAALDALPLRYTVTDTWAEGRYLSLQMALETPADAVHYVDADRLIRWVELYPDELRRTVDFIQDRDCVVIGRTPYAWETHPRCMYETEKIINDTFSTLLGLPVDVGAGSKGYSRHAVRCLLDNATPDDAFAMDAGWTVLLHRAGYKIDTLRVDGLDWETPDRYKDSAADLMAQRRMADEWDQDAHKWRFRVEVADRIINAGLLAWTQAR